MPLPDGHAGAEELEQPRRIDVPQREKLLQEYVRTEGLCRFVLGIELVATLALLGWLVLRGPEHPGALAWGAGALGFLGVFRFIPFRVFLNKKRLEDIRPDARFGEHTRDTLVTLCREVFARLGLPPNAAPIYLIREKDVNAHAVRRELWPGMRLFNGVFLNRGLIHLFDEPELACVIGHELGHVYPFAPLLSRSFLAHALLSGTASLCLLSAFPVPALAVGMPFMMWLLVDWLVAMPHRRLSRGIEFLCDDFGARAGGLLPAMSGEFKLAAENETRQDLMRRVLEAKKEGSRVPLSDLMEAYETAVPFGKADPAGFEREFGKEVAARRRRSAGVSLSGFLDFLGGGESTETRKAVGEELVKLRLIGGLPAVAVDRARYLRGSREWSEADAARLVTTIREQSKRVLFRALEELDDRGSTHPSASRRLLFLWEQRESYRLR